MHSHTRFWSSICSTMSRLRSYLGYPPVKNALPNVSHISLAALQHASVVPKIITQVKSDAVWSYLLSPLFKKFERTSTGYTTKPFNKLPHTNGTQYTHEMRSWNCTGLYMYTLIRFVWRRAHCVKASKLQQGAHDWSRLFPGFPLCSEPQMARVCTRINDIRNSANIEPRRRCLFFFLCVIKFIYVWMSPGGDWTSRDLVRRLSRSRLSNLLAWKLQKFYCEPFLFFLSSEIWHKPFQAQTRSHIFRGVDTTICQRALVWLSEALLFGPEMISSSFREVERCDQLLLIGTTLATYSAFR